jgi:hypothetical protein
MNINSDKDFNRKKIIHCFNCYLILLTLLISSCKENLEKEVLHGFKLGRNLEFNWEKEQELVRSGIFTNSDESKYPYVVNEFRYIGNNYFKYYYTPYFFKLKGDTTIVEIQVLFFTDKQNLDFDMERLGEGRPPMNIPNSPPMIDRTFVPGIQPISEYVLKKIVEKYGNNYEKIIPKDQVSLEEFTVVDTKYIWKNRDGVDIELIIQPMEDKGQNNKSSSLILKYKYTEEIRKKFKEKSVF